MPNCGDQKELVRGLVIRMTRVIAGWQWEGATVAEKLSEGNNKGDDN